MIIFVLCAPPGAGKTTLSQQLVKDNNAILHCFDLYSDAHSPSKAHQAHEAMWKNIVNDLQNSNVVVDDLHTKLEWRQKILGAISGIKCKRVLVIIRTPLEECLRRNANRKMRLPDFIVSDLYKKFEEPSLEEGWDEILYY